MPEYMKKQQKVSDQNALKHFLRESNPFHIKWGYLPIEFFGGGTLTCKIWEPGKSLPVPQNIIMHHANFTKGVDNKIAQLHYIKDIVKQRGK